MTPAEFHASFVATLRTRPAHATDALILRDWIEEQGVQPWEFRGAIPSWIDDGMPSEISSEVVRRATEHLEMHAKSRTWRATFLESRKWHWHTRWLLLHDDFPDALHVHLLLVQVESLTPTP